MELQEPQEPPRVQRLSVEPVVRVPRAARTQPPLLDPNQPSPRPMRAQDFHSADRDWDRPWPSPQRTEPFLNEPPPQPAPQKRPPFPKLDPKHLTPEQELARQAGILGAMEAASAILAARLLLFVVIAIAAVLAFNVKEVFSAGVFGAWIGVVLIAAVIDWNSRRRPS